MTVMSFSLLTACGSSSDSKDNTTNIPTPGSVTYELSFTSSWNASSFATNYPSNAHFSPLVGLTHNEQGKIFTMGETSSAGMVSMAETGSKSDLKDEIGNIQNLGNSNYLIDEGGIDEGDNKVTITFEASQDFSLLSVVSMVAPSPDWFVGIDSLQLFENNEWLESATVQLNVYDAGSDSGVSFKSSNTASSPKGVISLLSSNRSDSDFEEGVHFETKQTIGFMEIKKLN